MSILVRNFYTNTGLKGTPVDPSKPKLSVAYTAVRNEQGEQVVQFGVASCHAIDQFKRKEGLTIARTRLDLILNGATEIPSDVKPYVGTVVFSADTNLAEIPELITATFELQLFESKKATWIKRDSLRAKYDAAYATVNQMYHDLQTNPEFLKAQQAISEVEDELFGY